MQVRAANEDRRTKINTVTTMTKYLKKRQNNMKKEKVITNEKTVYLSGPITDCEFCKEQFDIAERYVRMFTDKVLNPMSLPDGLDYEQYMTIDLAMVDVCDLIIILPGARESSGCKREINHKSKPLLNYDDLVEEAIILRRETKNLTK